MNKILMIVSALILTTTALSAQIVVNDSMLQSGLEDLKAGDYADAASKFRLTLTEPKLEAFHPDALYLLIKAYIALEQYEDAAEMAYRYRVMYPSHGYLEEMEYQSSRLLYQLGEPEKAVVALGTFVEDYPDSDFIPSAYYWIGESLVDLGRLEEADSVYEYLLSRYPTSVKREAARYRRSEISLLYRERELLDLLKWSHEEYLNDAEAFYRREAEFRSAIETYGARTDEEAAKLRQDSMTSSILDAKADLLLLQRYYIEELLELADEL